MRGIEREGEEETMNHQEGKARGVRNSGYYNSYHFSTYWDKHLVEKAAEGSDEKALKGIEQRARE